MKKLSLYVFLCLFWCNVGFAERVTLGFVGEYCKSFNKSKDELGKEFDDYFIAEMMGFLTGYNVYIGIQDGGSKNMKILDHYSMDHAYSTIIEFCRKHPENSVYFGLKYYFDTLPNVKKN